MINPVFAAKPWGLASHFAVPAAAVRMIFVSDALLETPGRLAETLDQGLGAVHFRDPALHVAQPRHIRLAGLLAQSQLGIFQFPK